VLVDQTRSNSKHPSSRVFKPSRYLTNPIARASALMAELSANARARAQTKMAAE